MTLARRAAHLQGLFEGMQLDETKKETKIIGEMLDILAETTEELQRLSNENAALRQLISNNNDIDDVLDELEEDVDIDDGADYQIICPTCGEIMYIDYATIELGSINCKNCGELLEFDLSDLEEEDI